MLVEFLFLVVFVLAFVLHLHSFLHFQSWVGAYI